MQKITALIKKFIMVSDNPFLVRIISEIRFILNLIRYYRCSSNTNEYDYLEGKKKCFVFCAADYGNLGDVAITYAQSKYLSEKLPDYVIVDVPISKSISSLKVIKRICSDDDIITLTGGGYMGDLYFRSEFLRLLIVYVFRKYKVISFPQTADFSNTALGVSILRISQRIYAKCEHLELWAREHISYRFMCEKFVKNKIRLTPDIVMWLDERVTDDRNVITFCLRNDLEKNPHSKLYLNKLQTMIPQNMSIINYDTHIGNVKLNLDQRYEELSKIWTQFRRSRLVVTDRLHGMIFAYITGTPAVVLPNNNFKIPACYSWLKECGYIKYIKSAEDINSLDLFSISNTDKGYEETHKIISDIFDSINF